MIELQNVIDTTEAKYFLESIDIGEQGASLDVNGAQLPALPEYKTEFRQIVTVGSQIAEFERGFPEDLRPHATNSFLLAQLAANKTLQSKFSSIERWYETYLKVISNCGWVIEEKDFSLKSVGSGSLLVHKEIIPIIVKALGPAAAASSLIVDVLNGLQAMSSTQPWITLFNRESQRAGANQFQVSYANVADGKTPRISLSAFELKAAASVTQVLFFKLSSAKASLRRFETHVSTNKALIDSVRGLVDEKVREYVRAYVVSLDISEPKKSAPRSK